MIWNYANNRPLGASRDLKVSPDSLRKDFEEWIEQESERGVYNAEELESVKSALESVDYNLHEFMWTHAYNMIPYTKLREYFVVYMCLGTSPSAKLIPIDTEEFKGMDVAVVDILYKARDMRWGSQENVSDFDIYNRYYFCETEEDIWDIFADGVGDLRQLCNCYDDQDKDKELKALQYIYGTENKFLKATTGKPYQTCPQSVKKEIISIIKEDFYNGMDEGFFDEDNYENALFAWNLGLPEIRQEFIRNENALRILKRILQETIK